MAKFEKNFETWGAHATRRDELWDGISFLPDRLVIVPPMQTPQVLGIIAGNGV
jgi:hypothetical protein